MARLAAAIDFGTSKIAVAAGRLDERGYLRIDGAGQQVYAGFRDFEWLDVDSLEEAILSARKAAERQMGRRIRDVYVAVPGEFIRVAFNRAEVEVRNRNGMISRDDIERLVTETGEFDVPEGYVPLHRTPVAYLVDNQTRNRPPVGERGKYLAGYVSHIFALESFVDDIGSVLSGMGIGVLGMVAGPMGTGYLARMDNDTKRTAIVIDSGHFSTDIVVAEGDGLVFHENFASGGSTITNDIALIMNLPYEQAEALKRLVVLGIHRGEAVGNKKGLVADDVLQAQEIAEIRVWDMAGRIADVLANLGINYDGQTGVYLTGGGLGLLKGAKDILSAALGSVVKVYSHQSPLLGGPTYTGAAGALYYALNVIRDSAVKGVMDWIRDLF